MTTVMSAYCIAYIISV